MRFGARHHRVVTDGTGGIAWRPVAPAASLNADAGHHGITADPREVEAAVRAGEETLRRVPYVTWRFGDRGRRFGHSDSAWLAGLTWLAQEELERQIGWLGELLSARGMPRLLLERHLIVLREALAAAVPERAGDYAKLGVAAEHLRRVRVNHVAETSAARIAAGFDAAVGEEWASERVGVGELLVAAVADEHAGVEHAVSSLMEWLTDPERFSATWIAAVKETVSEARTHARRRRIA
jgi:hypothetical protein